MTKTSKPLVLDLSEVGAGDVELVGGKCASLGELFRALVPRGVRSVDGFATTSEAYRLLLETNGLRQRLRELLEGLDHNDIHALNAAGRQARALMLDTPLPETSTPQSLMRLRDCVRVSVVRPKWPCDRLRLRKTYLTLLLPDNRTRF